MMAVVQGMCARIGMVTGLGLAATIRKTCPLWLAYSLAAIVVVANTINIGADIAGMAGSANLVLHLPVIVWVFVFGLGLIFGQVFLSYRAIASVIKYLTLSLFAYVVTAFIVHPDWWTVLRHAVVPEVHLNGHWITTVMGVLGTTITPYLFFWQASLMVEEDKAAGKETLAERRGSTKSEIEDAHVDVNSGMLFSNGVMFFIIVTTASTLGAHGRHDISSAQDAAEALRPLAGNFAYLLFALGMIGTGLLAIPALAASSAYVASETFPFRHGGLDQPVRKAPRFYGVLTASMLIGIAMDLVHLDPIKALFWSAVLNGVAAVPILVAVVLIANNKEIMGRWKSSPLANAWGWFTVAVMAVAAVSMFVFWNQQ
jgi:Mn2+/Fe2+ NRAMP family transporter